MLLRHAGSGATRLRPASVLQTAPLSGRLCQGARRQCTARLHHRNSTLSAFRTRPQALASSTVANAPQWHPKPSTQLRFISDKPLPQRPRAIRYLYRIFAYLGVFVAVGGGIVLAFFIYDATTYRTEPGSQDVQLSELALNPRRGGPKNLPIAEHLVDDDDSPEKKEQKHKPKLVILGTGWASVAILKGLHPDEYHVTVVSPSNHFLFTPMLPSATVGTLELRSLVEPVRRIITRVKGHFIRAMAEDVDFSHKLVEISAVDNQGNKEHFYLPYDKLVVAVGK